MSFLLLQGEDPSVPGESPGKDTTMASVLQKGWEAGVSTLNSIAGSFGDFVSKMKNKLSKQEEL